MASKNSVKEYRENSYYHIYNRGVNKCPIFLDDQDYSVFLSYLQTYLTPKDNEALSIIISSTTSSPSDKDKARKLVRLKNYSSDLRLLCYALMPNHLHLLVHQQSNVINHFMNSIGTRYSMYFNRKYHRIGVLFQDAYKAVLVTSEEQLLHLSRYIHLNPSRQNLDTPCSLPEYLGLKATDWIFSKPILDYFSTTNTKSNYANFVAAHQDETLIYHQSIDPD